MGSQSTPTNFNERNLAQAGATAREALLRLAAERFGVPVEQLTAADGAVTVKSDASRRVTYGELVGGKKFAHGGRLQHQPCQPGTYCNSESDRGGGYQAQA